LTFCICYRSWIRQRPQKEIFVEDAIRKIANRDVRVGETDSLTFKMQGIRYLFSLNNINE